MAKQLTEAEKELRAGVRVDRGHLTELRKARAEQLARQRGEKVGGVKGKGIGALPMLALLLAGGGLGYGGRVLQEKSDRKRN